MLLSALIIPFAISYVSFGCLAMRIILSWKAMEPLTVDLCVASQIAGTMWTSRLLCSHPLRRLE